MTRNPSGGKQVARTFYVEQPISFSIKSQKHWQETKMNHFLIHKQNGLFY